MNKNLKSHRLALLIMHRQTCQEKRLFNYEFEVSSRSIYFRNRPTRMIVSIVSQRNSLSQKFVFFKIVLGD